MNFIGVFGLFLLLAFAIFIVVAFLVAEITRRIFIKNFNDEDILMLLHDPKYKDTLMKSAAEYHLSLMGLKNKLKIK